MAPDLMREAEIGVFQEWRIKEYGANPLMVD
jgi:hypothetical protein